MIGGALVLDAEFDIWLKVRKPRTPSPSPNPPYQTQAGLLVQKYMYVIQFLHWASDHNVGLC